MSKIKEKIRRMICYFDENCMNSKNYKSKNCYYKCFVTIQIITVIIFKLALDIVSGHK